MNLRIFGWSYAVTAVSLVVAYLYAGIEGLILCAILGILEISLSFDNAVVNATVLDRMNAFWQRIFLTVGILIAVFGMRLVFPLVIVAVTAGLNPVESLTLALEQRPPDDPTSLCVPARPGLPADRRVRRHVPVHAVPGLDVRGPRHQVADLAGAAAGQDRPAQPAVRACSPWSRWSCWPARWPRTRPWCSPPAASAWSPTCWSTGWATCSSRPAHVEVDEDATDEPAEQRAASGEGGPSELAKASGKAGFFLFLYLEVLDAAFSFDGVIGAFAITTDPILIALGLGLIGAMFVRSLTVFLVRKGTLATTSTWSTARTGRSARWR